MWSTRPNDDEPARILQEHGLELAAASVLDHVHAPFEQRGGVFGTARQILSFLRDPDIAHWVAAGVPEPAIDARTLADLGQARAAAEAAQTPVETGAGAAPGPARRAARELRRQR